MDIDGFVRLLGTFYRDGGKTIVAMHGQEAARMVAAVGFEVEKIVDREGPLQELWSNFKHSPEDYQSEVTELVDFLVDQHAAFEERIVDFFDVYDFGTENRLPMMRSDMVDEEDSDLYVRDLDTGLYSGTGIPTTGEESNPLDQTDVTGEDEYE